MCYYIVTIVKEREREREREKEREGEKEKWRLRSNVEKRWFGVPRRYYMRVYGELNMMLNQLGSGSISCLRPEVETERLVRSNERQDHRSVYLDML